MCGRRAATAAGTGPAGAGDLAADPVRDAETVETELMLADLESLEKRVPNLAKKAAQGDKEAKAAASVLGQALALLREGRPARLAEPKAWTRVVT